MASHHNNSGPHPHVRIATSERSSKLLTYVGYNLRVLPVWPAHDGRCLCPKSAKCSAAGKHPVATLVAHGVHAATTDAQQVQAWLSAFPAANWAIATGTPARDGLLLVLDIDPRNGGFETLERLEWEHGILPHTMQALTGGGGLHFFFRVPSGAGCRGRLGAGVDVKFRGGYVVAPPSVHVSGGVYRWAAARSPADVAPAELPPPWLNALRAAPPSAAPSTSRNRDAVLPTTDRERAARRYARALPGAISGENGHDTTFRAALKVARGFALDEESAFRVLRDEFNARCQPTWSERELRRKVREALQRGRSPMGFMLDRTGRR